MTSFAYQSDNRFLKVPAADGTHPYAVAGIAWDGATTNRPGARLGPRAIRQASHMLCDGIPLFDDLRKVAWPMRATCRCPTPAWKACAPPCRRWSTR